jgi:hypothetical protein
LLAAGRPAGGCKEIYDFERLLTRIEVGTANARDLIALKISLVPAGIKSLAGGSSQVLQPAGRKISALFRSGRSSGTLDCR